MITRAEAIDAIDFELEVTASDGQTYRIEDPINRDSDTDSAYVFDFQYAGSAQPSNMTRGSHQFEGWEPLTAAERARFETLLDHVESFANVDFQRVSGEADPTMNVGTVTLPGITAGTGGFAYSVSISGGSATLADYNNFVVYDNTLDIASGQDNLVLHEILHALAMKHPFDGTPTLPEEFENNKYTVLSYSANPDNGMRSDRLQIFDIAGIQNRWGANLETATGDDVYTGTRNMTVDAIWDAGGTDTFDASARTNAVMLSLGEATFSTFDDTDDVSIAYGAVIENATGGSGDDSITGNDVANVLRGGAGIDTISGGGENDVLVGGADNDILIGGSGGDSIFGGTGNDKMFGGAGVDRMFGGAGTDRMFGGAQNDIANGGADNDIINTGSGNDLVFAQAGNDLIFAQAGNDTVFGGTGNDSIFGGTGNDKINAGAGNDKVFAGAGADRIVGAGGNDLLSGGGGRDTFVFAAGQGDDTITDYTDVDRLDISVFAVTDGAGSDMDWRDATTSVGTAGGGSDVVIMWDGGGTLKLENTMISDLTDGDFLF